MIYLDELLNNVDIISSNGNLHIKVSGFQYDSRKIEQGMCFVAIRGFNVNGLQYVGDAVARGAAAVLFESKPDETFPDLVGNLTWVQVTNARIALSKMAAVFYKHAVNQFYSIGVTGTNGKTTIVSLIHAILNQIEPTARIGTLGLLSGDTIEKTTLTTPEAPDILSFLSRAASQGCKNMVMEVSSVALKLHRVEDIHFSQGIFTNFTGDHLDFHLTMDDYFQSKLILFKKLAMEDWAIINIDDPESFNIIDELNCRYITFGFSENADVKPIKYKLSLKGIQATIQTPKGNLTIKSNLIGRINLFNILAAIASTVVKGISFDSIIATLKNIPRVKGRLDTVYSGKFSVLIDYAHTDNALEVALKSLKEIISGKLFVVFGAGGSRDKSKRPRMGRTAAQFSDYVILTSDNPRAEEPQAIVNDIVKGFPPDFNRYTIELDREMAIRKAMLLANNGDLVIIAGKGHEDYQIFKDKTIHFDDYEVVQNVLKEMNLIQTEPGGEKHA